MSSPAASRSPSNLAQLKALRTPSSSVLASHSPAPSSVLETTRITRTRDSSHPEWRMLNSYRVGDTIGHGQFGKVKLGVDVVSNKDVAIKILKRKPDKKTLYRSNNQDRLRHEIAIMKKCQHDHIVRLFEVIDDPRGNNVFLVMEFCEGGEVLWHDRNDNPLLSLEQVRRIIRDVTLGLEYLHFNGIIHRDIKPANLLWTKNRARVKISDFGTAHYSPRLITAGKQAKRAHITRTPEFNSDGTPTMPPPTNGASGPPDETSSDDADGQHEYQLRNNAISPVFCSPELCFVQLARDVPMWEPGERPSGVTSSSKFPVSPALDVWAFGVTIWCLLFGRQPWTSDTRYQLFAEIIDEKPQERGFITSSKWPTPPVDDLESLDTRPAPAEELDMYSKACDPLSEETTADSGEASRIMRGMMVKLVHRRMTLARVKKSPWLAFDDEAAGDGTPFTPDLVVLSDEDPAHAIQERKTNYRRWPRFAKRKHQDSYKPPNIVARSIGRLRSSSQVQVADVEDPENEEGKGQNRTPRASTDVSPSGSPKRNPNPFASTATSISTASSPIVARHADHCAVKKPDESASSPRSRWKPFNIMKSFLNMTRGRPNKPHITSASANPIPTHSHSQTHHDLDLTQLDDDYSNSYPGGIDFSRRAKSVNEVNSVTEGEGEEDVLLITYDTDDEEFSDFDDPNPTRFLGAGGYGTPLPRHLPRLEAERVGHSLISLVNGGPSGTLASSGEVVSPPLCSPGDGSEPVRVFGRYFQHTTGTPGETSRDSYDDSTTQESTMPHSPAYRDGPQRQPRQRSIVRNPRQKFTTEDDADSDSDALEMPSKHKSRFG